MTTSPLNISSVIAAKEHIFLGRGTPAFRKAVLIGLDEEDIFQECALALWNTSLSPGSRWDPERGARSTYIRRVCSSAICKLIRQKEGHKEFPLPKLTQVDIYQPDTGCFGSLERESPIVDEATNLRDMISEEIDSSDLHPKTKEIAQHLLLHGALPEGFPKTSSRYITARKWLKQRLAPPPSNP